MSRTEMAEFSRGLKNCTKQRIFMKGNIHLKWKYNFCIKLIIIILIVVFFELKDFFLTDFFQMQAPEVVRFVAIKLRIQVAVGVFRNYMTSIILYICTNFILRIYLSISLFQNSSHTICQGMLILTDRHIFSCCCKTVGQFLWQS